MSHSGRRSFTGEVTIDKDIATQRFTLDPKGSFLLMQIEKGKSDKIYINKFSRGFVALAIAIYLIFQFFSCSPLDKHNDDHPQNFTALLRTELVRSFENFQGALRSNDTEKIKTILHQGYFGFSPDGQKHGITQLLKVWGSGEMRLSSQKFEDLEYKVFEKTGIVTGIANIEGKHLGRYFESHLRFMDIYLYDGKTWHLYSSIATKLAKITGVVE